MRVNRDACWHHQKANYREWKFGLGSSISERPVFSTFVFSACKPKGHNIFLQVAVALLLKGWGQTRMKWRRNLQYEKKKSIVTFVPLSPPLCEPGYRENQYCKKGTFHTWCFPAKFSSIRLHQSTRSPYWEFPTGIKFLPWIRDWQYSLNLE